MEPVPTLRGLSTDVTGPSAQMGPLPINTVLRHDMTVLHAVSGKTSPTVGGSRVTRQDPGRAQAGTPPAELAASRCSSLLPSSVHLGNSSCLLSLCSQSFHRHPMNAQSSRITPSSGYTHSGRTQSACDNTYYSLRWDFPQTNMSPNRSDRLLTSQEGIPLHTHRIQS